MSMMLKEVLCGRKLSSCFQDMSILSSFQQRYIFFIGYSSVDPVFEVPTGAFYLLSSL